MQEELTAETCPESGVAQVIIIVGWKPLDESEWRYDGPFFDFIRIMPQPDCQHMTTTCRGCVDTWRTDYIIQLAPPGTPVPPLIED